MNYYVSKRVYPALNYYGGKFLLCRRILQAAPLHTTYVECFAGGLSVLLNKYRSDVEVACDVNSGLINFYCVLMDRHEELVERIQEVKFDRESFLAAKAADGQGDDLTRAVNFFCQYRLSLSGQGSSWTGSDAKKMKWENLSHNLKAVAERLSGVKILLRSAFDVIPEYDSPDTLYYIDPPYYNATRIKHGAYVCEFTEMDHLRLLRLLNTLHGNVILSGYDYPLYTKELIGWNRIEIDVAAHSSSVPGERPRRTEVLWVKP